MLVIGTRSPAVAAHALAGKLPLIAAGPGRCRWHRTQVVDHQCGPVMQELAPSKSRVCYRLDDEDHAMTSRADTREVEGTRRSETQVRPACSGSRHQLVLVVCRACRDAPQRWRSTSRQPRGLSSGMRRLSSLTAGMPRD
jgi:hypothetical protein